MTQKNCQFSNHSNGNQNVSFYEDRTRCVDYLSSFCNDSSYIGSSDKIHYKSAINSFINNKFYIMQKNFFIEVVNESVIEKGFNKSKNEEFPKIDFIPILDWGWIFNKYSSIYLMTDVPLKRSEILNKLYYHFNLVKNSGIIGHFSVEPSGVCEFSDRPEYIETTEGNVRYIRLLLRYNS